MHPLKKMIETATRWTKTLSPNCREVTQLQSRSLDGPLPMPSRVGMVLHLGLCKWCRRYGKQLRFLRDTLQREDPELTAAPRYRLPTTAREQLHELMRRDSEE